MSVAQFTRDNHFVPQWYLKSWADGSRRVWSYRLLVSHKTVGAWQHRAPRGLAFHDDLYTTVRDRTESDDFEHWLEREFEAPAQVALARVLNDLPLAPHHWQHLGRYAVCQQLRTPQYFLESMERWNKTLPALMQDTLGDPLRRCTAFHEKGVPLPQRPLTRGRSIWTGRSDRCQPCTRTLSGMRARSASRCCWDAICGFESSGTSLTESDGRELNTAGP